MIHSMVTFVFILQAWLFASSFVTVQAIVSGSAFLVDNYCWGLPNRIAIDGAPLSTNPGAHTAHCMFDIPACVTSGYILVSKRSNNNQFEKDYALSAESNQVMINWLQMELQKNAGRKNLFLQYTGRLNGNNQLVLESYADCPNNVCKPTVFVGGTPTKSPTTDAEPNPTKSPTRVRKPLKNEFIVEFPKSNGVPLLFNVQSSRKKGGFTKIRIELGLASYIGFGLPGSKANPIRMVGGIALIGMDVTSNPGMQPIGLYNLTQPAKNAIFLLPGSLSDYGIFNASFTINDQASVMEFRYRKPKSNVFNRVFDLFRVKNNEYIMSHGSDRVFKYHTDRRLAVINLRKKKVIA